MAHQNGIGHAEGIHALMQRILKYSSSTGKALFQHQIFFAQQLLQNPGPAFIFIKTVAAVGAIGRIRTVAMGIGISQTDNVFFHIKSPSKY
jgi:hypothetical protein